MSVMPRSPMHKLGLPPRPPRLGLSKYPYRSDEELDIIVRRLAAGKSVSEVAAESGWAEEQVRDARAAFFPTKGLAKSYLLANTLRLARRVVEEANVEESIDILSRPDIGVLAPAQRGAAPQQVSVMTSINPADLGGVQVAVMTGAPAMPPPTPQEIADHAWAIPPALTPPSSRHADVGPTRAPDLPALIPAIIDVAPASAPALAVATPTAARVRAARTTDGRVRRSGHRQPRAVTASHLLAPPSKRKSMGQRVDAAVKARELAAKKQR